MKRELFNIQSPHNCHFNIKNTVYVTEKDPAFNAYDPDSKEYHRVCKETVVRVETFGRLATVCFEKMGDGRGVRIIARLGMFFEGLCVIADHVEFKAVKRQDTKAETEQDKPVTY